MAMAVVPFSPATPWSPLTSASNDVVPQARQSAMGSHYVTTTPSNTMKKLSKCFDLHSKFPLTPTNGLHGQVPKTPRRKVMESECEGVVPDELELFVDQRPSTEDTSVTDFDLFR
eukprot:CFRG1913T1